MQKRQWKQMQSPAHDRPTRIACRVFTCDVDTGIVRVLYRVDTAHGRHNVFTQHGQLLSFDSATVRRRQLIDGELDTENQYSRSRPTEPEE